MLNEGYSLSDIAAVSGNEGFGNGGSAWWIIILFLFCFMGGGAWGTRSASDYGQFATAASQQEILFGQQFQGLNTSINKVGDGISSLGYSQLQQMDANTTSINGNIVNEGRALQMQLADCCCSNKEAISQVRYDMANFNNQQITAIHAEGEATRALLQQNKIESLQGQINSLQLQNAVAGVVRYPMASTYSSGANPFCNCNCCGC